MKEIRRKFTYANVMSSLAVFLVLGGATAFAATHLGKNSVGSAQLKANAVTAKKIANGAVSGAKVQSNSLSGSQIQDGSVTGSDIATNSITGTQINAASLPPVPTADRTAGEFTMTLPLNSAQSVPVDVPAPFYAFASCSDLNFGDRAGLVVGSDAAGSTFSNGGGGVPLQDFFKIQLVGIDLPEPHDGHPTTVQSQQEKFFATSAAGTMISVEDVSVSINVGPDRNCVFSGNIQRLNSD